VSLGAGFNGIAKTAVPRAGVRDRGGGRWSGWCKVYPIEDARTTCRYVIKTDNPSRFFEIKGVWADPAMALEFGSMYLCCKNCNNAADKAGATNIQMCLYQDLVEARAALADQAP
jgi:hypothetical protein